MTNYVGKKVLVSIVENNHAILAEKITGLRR